MIYAVEVDQGLKTWEIKGERLSGGIAATLRPLNSRPIFLQGLSLAFKRRNN